jgi:hypothetical protein
MPDTLIRESFTAAELLTVRDAATRGIVRAIDARTDGRADCDGLSDARRIGERIADGFAILNSANK